MVIPHFVTHAETLNTAAVRNLTCRLAHVENIHALSIGLIALPCREGAGLEMIGGWAGGKKVDDGSVTRRVPPSEPYPNDWMAFSVMED